MFSNLKEINNNTEFNEVNYKNYSEKFNSFINQFNLNKSFNKTVETIWDLKNNNKIEGNYLFFKEFSNLIKEIKSWLNETNNLNEKEIDEIIILNLKKIVNFYDLFESIFTFIKSKFLMLKENQINQIKIIDLTKKLWLYSILIIQKILPEINDINKFVNFIQKIFENLLKLKTFKINNINLFYDDLNEILINFKDETQNNLKSNLDDLIKNYLNLENKYLFELYRNNLQDNELDLTIFLNILSKNNYTLNQISPIINYNKPKNFNIKKDKINKNFFESPSINLSEINTPINLQNKIINIDLDKQKKNMKWLQINTLNRNIILPNINNYEETNILERNCYFSKNLFKIIRDKNHEFKNHLIHYQTINLLCYLKEIPYFKKEPLSKNYNSVIENTNKLFITQLEKFINDELLNTGNEIILKLILESNFLEILHFFNFLLVLQIKNIYDDNLVELIKIKEIKVINLWKILITFARLNNNTLTTYLKSFIVNLENEIVLKVMNLSFDLDEITELNRVVNNFFKNKNADNYIEKIFISKLLKICGNRINSICMKLDIMEQNKDMVWKIFKFCLLYKIVFFKNLSLDFIILASIIFIYFKNININNSHEIIEKFTFIYKVYKTLSYYDSKIKIGFIDFYKVNFLPNIQAFKSIYNLNEDPNSTPFNLDVNKKHVDINKILNSPLCENYNSKSNNLRKLNLVNKIVTLDNKKEKEIWDNSWTKTKSLTFSEENINKVNQIKMNLNEEINIDSLIKTKNILSKSDLDSCNELLNKRVNGNDNKINISEFDNKMNINEFDNISFNNETRIKTPSFGNL